MNGYVIVGSSAMKHWFSDFNRDPKDVDIQHDCKGSYDYYTKNQDHFRPEVLNQNKRIEQYFIDVPAFNESLKKYTLEYITPKGLLTLKASHIFWDINWDKHMYDIQFLIGKGFEIDKEVFYDLYNFWNVFHGKNKRSNLNMSSEDFFNNVVKCEYDHDWLHTLIRDHPTYNKVLKDGAEVDVDEAKFNNLSFEDKLSLVREEVYVMAYERYTDVSFRHAYGRMLKKFIMNHAPIWEALFIIENYITLLKPEYNFIKLINEKINDGRPIKYKQIQ